MNPQALTQARDCAYPYTSIIVSATAPLTLACLANGF